MKRQPRIRDCGTNGCAGIVAKGVDTMTNKPTELKEINSNMTDEITCPWCGYELRDSWEYPDYEEDLDCPECGKLFSMQRNVYTDYTTKKLEAKT